MELLVGTIGMGEPESWAPTPTRNNQRVTRRESQKGRRRRIKMSTDLRESLSLKPILRIGVRRKET